MVTIMIKINNEQDKVIFNKEDSEIIEKIFIDMLTSENIPLSAEASLVLMDNSDIRELNREYRNIDSATDVLSFPIYEDFELKNIKEGNVPEEILLGDIVISLEKAEEQSKEFNHSFKREFMYLFVHGMLHLLGHDHLEEDEKKEMRSREEAILEKFSLTR
jgi:probable rRNA maturation factor